MTIREFAESREFEIVGKLNLVKTEKDGTRIYIDEAGNEFIKGKRGICIVDLDGAVY